MSPTRCHLRTVRRRAPGNALLEFALTLPIIIFMTGVTIYMAMAMLTKQQAVVEARYHLWIAANGSWAPMKLEGWAPTGNLPDPSGGDMPRGSGDELTRLYPEVFQPALNATTSSMAQDYANRIWGNLPGRQHTHAERSFQSRGGLWDFIDHTATSDHYRDTSPWHFYDLDAWKIARTGPCKAIFEAFRDNLPATVAPHFKPTRDDIYNHWWHANDILSDEARIGSGGVYKVQ